MLFKCYIEKLDVVSLQNSSLFLILIFRALCEVGFVINNNYSYAPHKIGKKRAA